MTISFTSISNEIFVTSIFSEFGLSTYFYKSIKNHSSPYSSKSSYSLYLQSSSMIDLSPYHINLRFWIISIFPYISTHYHLSPFFRIYHPFSNISIFSIIHELPFISIYTKHFIFNLSPWTLVMQFIFILPIYHTHFTFDIAFDLSPFYEINLCPHYNWIQ